MQSFSSGWSFFTQACGMAFQNKDMVILSKDALLVGFFISLIGFMRIAGAYHACLYIWANEAKKNQTPGQPVRCIAPAPLAAVLG